MDFDTTLSVKLDQRTMDFLTALREHEHVNVSAWVRDAIWSKAVTEGKALPVLQWLNKYFNPRAPKPGEPVCKCKDRSQGIDWTEDPCRLYCTNCQKTLAPEA